MSAPVILSAALALLQQVIPPTIPLPPSAPGQVIAWDSLPPAPFRQAPAIQADMSAFVAGEIASGRCQVDGVTPQRGVVVVDVAMLMMPDTGPRLTIPRAIDCPSVEQYAAGLVLSFSRNNLTQRPTLAPQWYRATLRFKWPD